MKRGEIWLINLDPSIGAEISKTRPAIIINDDEIGILPLRVIVPITDWKGHYNKIRWMVHIAPTTSNGLQKDSSADAFQLKSVSTRRFVKILGEVSPADLNALTVAIAVVLKIPRF